MRSVLPASVQVDSYCKVPLSSDFVERVRDDRGRKTRRWSLVVGRWSLVVRRSSFAKNPKQNQEQKKAASDCVRIGEGYE